MPIRIVMTENSIHWPILIDRVRARPEGKKGNFVAHYDLNGKHCKKSLKTRREDVARKAAARLESQLQTKGHVAAPRKMLIVDAKLKFMEFKNDEGIHHKTFVKYDRELLEFATFCEEQHVLHLHQLDETLYLAYRKKRAATNLVRPGEPLAEKTLALSLTILHTFVKWCATRSHMSTDPFAHIKIKKPPFRSQFCPTKDVVDKVLHASSGDLTVILSVLAFTGMRSGELQLLRTRDVDLAGNWITIQTLKSKLSKIRPTRKVPIHPRLRPIIESHLKQNADHELLFTADASNKYPEGGHQINTKHLNDRLCSLASSLGFPVGRKNDGFVIHAFRHYFESATVNSNVSQPTIDAWLGHAKDKSMGAIYYRLNDVDSQRLMTKVEF